MNIHITDQDLFENLQAAALCRLEIGSKLYGLAHAESDTDYLYILPRTIDEGESFLSSHHQIQYKDTDKAIDHNFTNLYAFITNCLSGDNTINFECLHSPQLHASPLHFLGELAPYFRNYHVIRAYLGFCDRDIRHYNRHKSLKDKASAIIHIQRGYLFAQAIFEDKFELLLPELITYAKTVRQAYEMKDYQVYELMLPTIQQEVKNFRQNKVNKALESKQLAKNMLPHYQALLDEKLQVFVKSDFYRTRQAKISAINAQKLLHIYYHAYEYWVDYT
ncbi:MAG: nucleotidyltransferase domain-containing protein [Thermoflexibacter sp.]|jgi:hypothetical protein|nr:nucleotidyltransferase domain-containing protein [Thermoflexibacter sp.]